MTDERRNRGASPARPERISKAELIQQLIRLGEQRAMEIVNAAAKHLRIPDASDFDRKHALAILDHLAGSSGVVGSVASFAKARLALDRNR